MSYKKQLFLVAILFISIRALGQTEAGRLDTLAGHFISALRTEQHEKIIVHTDKWFYVAGEQVWFKAYSIDALSGKYFLYSKILYADLVNDHDSVIAQLMLNNALQQTAGMILLPASIREGYYWLRAYTQNILHKDTGLISVQPLYIISKRTAGDQSAQLIAAEENKNEVMDTSKPVVTFFPEGGSLISGTNTQIGFRATDAGGKPLNISGYIKDSWDSVVTQFSTAMPGVGKLNFFVWRARKYIAHINWNNHEYLYPLPPVDQYASQLSVEDRNDHLLLRVSLGDSVYKKKKLTYILAVSRDSLCFAGFGQDMYEVTIPKKNLPPGRAVLILFDDQYKVVSERSIYVNNSDSITIRPDKTNYARREKAQLDITIGDTANRDVSALFSLAITDDNFARQSLFKNPVENLIQTNIELPPAADTKNYSAADWDIIMLTNKPIYTDWKYLATQPAPAFVEDTGIFNIRGRILNGRNQPVPDRIVTLFSNEKLIVALSDTTDQRGNFSFVLPAFPDSTKFMLQVSNKKGIKQDDRIVVNKFLFPRFKTPAYLKKRFSVDQVKIIRDFENRGLDTLLIGSGKEWLKPVIVKSYKKKSVNSIDNRRISNFSKIIQGRELENKGTNALSFAILGVPGMHLRQGFLVMGGGNDFKISARDEPILVIDGQVYTTSTDDPSESVIKGTSPLMSALQYIDPSIVDFVEVFSGAESSVYGFRGGAGVIYVHTRSSLRADTTEFGRGVMRIIHKGYFETPPFDYPDYTKKEFKESPYPDHRSTLFWNGSVLAGKNGKVSINFFTADEPTTYTVTIMGVTAKGNLIYKQEKVNRQ